MAGNGQIGQSLIGWLEVFLIVFGGLVFLFLFCTPFPVVLLDQGGEWTLDVGVGCYRYCGLNSGEVGKRFDPNGYKAQVL
jgi:hypothetical protein